AKAALDLGPDASRPCRNHGCGASILQLIASPPVNATSMPTLIPKDIPRFSTFPSVPAKLAAPPDARPRASGSPPLPARFHTLNSDLSRSPSTRWYQSLRLAPHQGQYWSRTSETSEIGCSVTGQGTPRSIERCCRINTGSGPSAVDTNTPKPRVPAI